MQIISKWMGNLDFEAVNEKNQKIMMSDSNGDLGPSPTNLVLMGLGGCTGMDVVSILTKMRVNFDRFEVIVDGTRAIDPPKVFKQVTIIYRIWGQDIAEKKFTKAINLTQKKYCSVLHTVNKTAEIDYRYEINPAD